MLKRTTLSLLLSPMLLVAVASAEDTASPSDKHADNGAVENKVATTVTVEAAPLKITTNVEGFFVAREAAEVVLRPEEWKEFKIVEIAPHGSTVSKGEVLVRFESKELDEQIKDVELELRLSELAILKDEQELPRATEEIERQHKQAQRAFEEAKADYQRYREVDREMSLKSAEMRLKNIEQSVENTREELRQLEKMYEADDLTEETEEIVLKRQRHAVEQAEFRLEGAKQDHEVTVNIDIPRRDIARKESLDRVELALKRSETALETDRARAKYELEKQRQSRLDAIQRHANLVQDRALIEVRSPADGVVYYGGAVDGKWDNTSKLIGSMRPFGDAPVGSVMMTIVKLRPLYVIGSVEESVRPSIKIGQSAAIETAAEDGPQLSGKLEKIASIPQGDKKYRVELSVESEEIPEWVVPGLTAKAKITTYENDEALMVPKSAIKTDDNDSKYVMVASPEIDKPQKQAVKVGKSKDDKVEIVDGLEAGDKVLVNKD